MDPVPAGRERRPELEDELARVVDVLVHRLGATQVVLFGSVARGGVHADSDLDVLAVIDTPLDFYSRRRDAILAIAPQVALDLFVFTPQEIERALESGHRYLQEILAEGRILHEG